MRRGEVVYECEDFKELLSYIEGGKEGDRYTFGMLEYDSDLEIPYWRLTSNREGIPDVSLVTSRGKKRIIHSLTEILEEEEERG